MHMVKKSKGKKGYLAIKIDLEKAYDRLIWDFVGKVLEEIELLVSLIKIIMACISMASFKLLWKGEMFNSFFPSRGIYQGEPMSAYIFVLCMEKLSQLIMTAMEDELWKGIRAGRNGPEVMHLLFSDDILLFREATMDQTMCIVRCIIIFCSMSCQKMNLQKNMRPFLSKCS